MSARRRRAQFVRPLLIGSLALGLLAAAAASAADSATRIERGRAVYQKWCLPCHGPGQDHPGTMALAALYRGAKPAVLAQRTDLTPDIVKHYVRTGVSIMPFFRKTEISDAELDDLAAFLSRRR